MLMSSSEGTVPLPRRHPRRTQLRKGGYLGGHEVPG